ncbi:MAG: DUF2868 domain-containing protein [Candidatus Wenzhouxiangella sp. M2_3B_020]
MAFPDSPTRRALTPRDWLMAESTRRIEEAAGDVPTDDEATRTAAGSGGDVATRIVERARRRPGAERLADDIDRTLTALRWTAILLIALGFVAGVAAAANVRLGDGTIALSWALMALLGVPMALLLLWAGVTLAPGRSGATPGLPGRLAWTIARVAGPRIKPGRRGRAIAGSVAELGRRHGSVLMATTTHAFWTAFYAGCIGWFWLLFLGLRFDFSWETTLLSGRWLEDLVVMVGTPPAWLFGLQIPDPEQVRLLLTDRSAPGDRGLWASWLIGTLALYGFAPRALLAVAFGWRWRRTRLELALDESGYLRLLPALSEPSRSLAPDRDPAPLSRAALPRPADPGTGAPVLVGVELDPEQTPWPPADHDCRVLGRADDRRQRAEIRRALELLEPRPEKIVALCALDRTPDRGTGTWLAELAAIAPVEIRLTEGRGDRIESEERRQRAEDWARLAERFGLPEPGTEASRVGEDGDRSVDGP